MTGMPARVQAHYEAIREGALAIIASPEVDRFCIGITGRPKARRLEYRRALASEGMKLEGFVLLDWDRTGEQAIALERWLFGELKKSSKYDNHENVSYFASVKRTLPSQAVYIAWWRPR